MSFLTAPTLDQWALESLHLGGHPHLASIAKIITHLGDGMFLILISTALLILLIRKKDYRKAILWLFLVTSTFLISLSLKQFFGRARPDEIYHLIHAGSPALPSGHALRSTVVYIVGVQIICSVFQIRKGRKLLYSAAIILVAFIGLSRIFLGVHWMTDVLAAWLIALIFIQFADKALSSHYPTDPIHSAHQY